jgi:hypothetical protein
MLAPTSGEPWLTAGNTEQPYKNSYRQQLEANDSLCLQAFRALLHLKLHRLAFVQALVSLALNRREMDKYVLPRLALDEAIIFCRVEPSTLFFAHFCCC